MLLPPTYPSTFIRHLSYLSVPRHPDRPHPAEGWPRSCPRAMRGTSLSPVLVSAQQRECAPTCIPPPPASPAAPPPPPPPPPPPVSHVIKPAPLTHRSLGGAHFPAQEKRESAPSRLLLKPRDNLGRRRGPLFFQYFPSFFHLDSSRTAKPIRALWLRGGTKAALPMRHVTAAESGPRAPLNLAKAPSAPKQGKSYAHVES